MNMQTTQKPQKGDASQSEVKKSFISRIVGKLRQSGFFIGALAFHLAGLIVLGGIVILEYTPPTKYEEPDVYLSDENEEREGVEYVRPDDSTQTNAEIMDIIKETAITETTSIDMKNIIMSESIDGSFIMSSPGIKVDISLISDLQDSIQSLKPVRSAKQNISVKAFDQKRLEKIRERIGQSEKGKGFDLGKSEKNGVSGLQATFTCYVASYQGGDWDHNVKLSPDRQRITFGAIPNLMTQMTRWNKRLKAQVEAIPLDLANRAALFDSKPPVAFIYFTGHRDFKLTEAEVSNLRDYIQAGGVIWGDAGMPGRNSRFDRAFRREMRRVLPDEDQQFQPLDDRHPIFQQKGSLVKTLPSGLNFYHEPIEVMMVGNQIGVIYTLNSYGNLWQIALDQKGKILEVFDEGTAKNPNETFTNRHIWTRRTSYYRNVDQDTVTHAYQLGMNIIVHLILQYQEELIRAPGL